MKLLRLTLKNFGPYQNEESIDFRALRYSRLFLIHGPVGSGKTFILDGICFALYGRSSGGERARLELRNLSAAESEDTVVALDFESGTQSYRVERRFGPDTEGPETDDVTLFRLPEIGEPTRRDILSATTPGVASMVEKLLGLTAEQFCQVAILPQGRFRRFLLAEGEQRREILSNMFGSARHARLQDAIGRAHNEAKSDLETAWASRESLIARYSKSGGDPRESLSRSTEELRAVELDCEQHQEKSVEWEKSLEEAVRYEILDRQRDMSERELLALSGEDQDPQDALAESLREALPTFERWKKLTEEAEVISAELHEQRAQYESLKQNTNFLEDEVRRARQLEEERFNLKRNLERLDVLLDDCEGVEILTAEMTRTQNRLSELTEKRTVLAADVRREKAQAKTLEAELEKISEAQKKLDSLKGELRRVSEEQDKVRQSNLLADAYDQAMHRVERLERMVEQLEKQRKKVETELHKQKDRDLADALRELKGMLEDGEPCPLCGSEEHPKPYSGRRRRRKGELQSEEALDSIDRKLASVRKELAQALERRARLDGRREERGIGPTEAEELDDQTVRRLKQTVIAVEQRVSRKDDIRKELREIKEDLKPARAKLKKMRLLKERLSSTIESIESQRRARQAGVFQLAKDIMPDIGTFTFEELAPRVESESRQLNERLEELANVTYSTDRAELMAETFALQLAESRASEKERDRLLAEAADLRQTLVDSFRKDFSGWDDLAFALGRMARESTVQGGQSPVLDRDTLIRTVERQLSQSQELLATLPVPQMKAEQIRQALAREREHLEYKVSRRVQLEKSLETSSEDVTRYDSLVEEIRVFESRVQLTSGLRNLAEGSDERVNFHDWYLERVFRRVLAAANLRLEILAPNRFCLVLHSGLEVKIMDFNAAKERAATTLSGGESFLASLALALGLGDVLQVERAARERLQTLFIDEGFGYLDRRALEASLDCLESLKQEGRSVGIISHVNALRDRIRAQLVVASTDAPLPYGVDRVQIFA